MEKTFTETLYVICHNGADVIHPMKVEAGTTLATGQPHYEEFATEEEWNARLTELGYTHPSPLADLANLEAPIGPEDLATLRADRKALRAARTPENKEALREIRQSLRGEREAIRAAQTPEEKRELRKALKAKRLNAIKGLSTKE